MSKKIEVKKLVRISTDHDRVKDEYPIGTRLVLGNRGAIVAGHVQVEVGEEKCLWITVTNIETGDWFNADPYFWNFVKEV